VCCLIVEFIVKVGRSLTFVWVRLALLVGGKLLLAGGKTVPRTQWSSFVSGRRVGKMGWIFGSHGSPDIYIMRRCRNEKAQGLLANEPRTNAA
jgi:hypothetical protein